MRYGYFGYDQRKTSVNRVDYEHIAFVEVNPALGGGHTAFKERLHSWALDMLRTGRHEAGLFTFSYCEIEEDELPGTLLHEVFIGWDGEREVGGVATAEG